MGALDTPVAQASHVPGTAAGAPMAAHVMHAPVPVAQAAPLAAPPMTVLYADSLYPQNQDAAELGQSSADELPPSEQPCALNCMQITSMVSQFASEALQLQEIREFWLCLLLLAGDWYSQPDWCCVSHQQRSRRHAQLAEYGFWPNNWCTPHNCNIDVGVFLLRAQAPGSKEGLQPSCGKRNHLRHLYHCRLCPDFARIEMRELEG